MSNIVLLFSTHDQMDASNHTLGQPVRFSLPDGATLGTRDNKSGRWVPLMTEKSKPRHWTNDWSVLD